MQEGKCCETKQHNTICNSECTVTSFCVKLMTYFVEPMTNSKSQLIVLKGIIQRHDDESSCLLGLALWPISDCTVMSIQMCIISAVHMQTIINHLAVNVYFMSCALVLL